MVTERELAKGWRRAEVSRHWLVCTVFGEKEQRVVKIMILPAEMGKPSYRDAELPCVARRGCVSGSILTVS